jgi:hypothetical protein
MSSSLGPLVMMLLTRTPYFLIWLVGLILAVVYWSRYPRPALLTAIAVALLFVTSIGHAVLWNALITGRTELADKDFELKMVVLGWGASIIGVIPYGLLFWAVFSARAVYAPVRRRPLVEENDEAPADKAPDPSTDIRTSRQSDRE